MVSNPKRPNEITLISVTSAFPARFVQDVAFLRDCYDSRVSAGDGAQARFELHTEGDGKQWPDLFVRKITRVDALPLLLLANAIGKASGTETVQNVEDPETGKTGLYLITKDDAGRDNKPLLLGSGIADASERLDEIAFDELDRSVETSLNKAFLLGAKRRELYANVRAAVDEIQVLRTNPLDAVRLAYSAADRAVEARLDLSK